MEQTRNLASGSIMSAMALCMLCMGGPAMAQAFPSKPINIVVPYTAGGPTDVTARLIAELLGRALGGTVVVENRPGASTAVAASYVARAPKDGYTLLFAPGTTTSTNPFIYKSLPYRLEDFAPISLVSRQPFVLTAGPALTSKTIAEFVQAGRADREGVTFGTTGTGSLTHVIGEWIGRTTGVTMINIPYKGTSQALGDLLGARVQAQVEGIVSSVPLHAAGKVRVLGVLSEERSSALPDVPTFKEAGYPDLVAYIYFGLMAPAQTPQPVLDRLGSAVREAVADPEFAARISGQGEIPISSKSQAEYLALLKSETRKWGEIIGPLNLPMQ